MYFIARVSTSSLRRNYIAALSIHHQGLMRNIAVAALAACILTFAAPAQARRERPLNSNPDVRSVHGIVTTAEDRPAKGAVVLLEDTKTLSIRSYVCGGDGEYHFANLSTNVDYRLHAEDHGRRSPQKTLSSFNTRKDAVVNLRLR